MSKLFWVVVIFLLIGGYMIKVAYDYDFGKSGDTQNFVVRFGTWVMQLGGNMVSLVTYGAHQQWLPVVNQTNQTMNSTRE
jgi:hypothetical protein